MGCFQHEGVDYHDSHSPVLSEVVIRILLFVYLKNKDWKIQQMDIEEEFLEAKLDETIYVRLPKGLNLITKRERKWGLLNRSIYGLVQASRKFHLELNTYLTKELYFIQSPT